MRQLHINGLIVFIDPNLTKNQQYRFARSKKRRIKKKWFKRRFNFKIAPDHETIYKTPMGLVCHPVLAQKMMDLKLCQK